MKRIVETLLVLCALAIGGAGCGDAGDDAPVADAMPPPSPDADVCMGVGATCNGDGTCADGLMCYLVGQRGVCSTERATCGGIIHTSCTGDGLSCVNLMGSEQGICVTAEELSCICATSPDAVTGC
jgi:hypothetical protein